jgi:protein-S-isoprenylcysteine O-methyltransferase Ste14
MSPTPIIVALWVVFYTFWLISAIGVKKAVRVMPKGRLAGLRLAIIIAAILLVRFLRKRQVPLIHPSHHVLGVVGLVLCLAGLGFAVWARLHLGRNWGTPMSLKEGHELVTSGPYQYVRHPIYSGILLALVGSGLAAGLFWLLLFIIICPYFAYSAKTEERLMAMQFPDKYPEYKKRTNALVPFVW